MGVAARLAVREERVAPVVRLAALAAWKTVAQLVVATAQAGELVVEIPSA